MNDWINPKKLLPFSGERVLTIRSYLGDYGWTDPIYMVDSGWHKFDNFEWNMGGKVLWWMSLPPAPPKEAQS
jgi:hypothetical protein